MLFPRCTEIYAGAIGAALWGAFRHAKLNALQEQLMAKYEALRN